MTFSPFAAGMPGAPLAPIAGIDGYQPGVCNIGPAEIARRRRSGHVALVATFALLALLIAIGAPPLARLLLILPAAAAASGYLQARLRFCAGFGSRGVFNFGELGPMHEVADAADKARDRARARQIGFAALVIGAVVAVIAVLLPV
jgi:ferric-dicitrate binding protein FerR (iron transport regulator)